MHDCGAMAPQMTLEQITKAQARLIAWRCQPGSAPALCDTGWRRIGLESRQWALSMIRSGIRNVSYWHI